MPAAGQVEVGASVLASREKAFAAEQGIAGIRAAIITLNSFVFLAWMDKSGPYAPLAYGIVVAAHAYGYGVYLLKPYRRFPVMMSSYFTSALDAAFITLWILATGGVGSPFYVLWYASVTAIAFRFGAAETLAAALLYAACYAGLLLALGEALTHPVELVVRTSYVFFIAAIGAYFARETLAQTTEKVEARRLAAALRESEERFRRLSDATFEGIAIHEGGRILEANRAFGEIFGYGRDEAIGRHALDFVAPESRPAIEERLRAKSDAPYEVLGRRKDGSTFPLEVVARDFPLAGRAARVVAVRDVTERAANRTLRELDRLKSQFINAAAHELNSPLTPIKLQSHLLKVGTLGPLNEQQRKAVAVVARNADHLGLLVRDVLDSARIQGGKLAVRRAPLDATRLVEEAHESFAEAARAAGVRLDVEAERGLRATADGARINQVVYNLLSNALKFTPEGGRVLVRARAWEGGVRVDVEDSGAGIRDEDVGRLFTPFTQVHDTMQATQGGTGLGLYISKGIVEQHGGRIACESGGPGRGARFWFWIPA